MSFFMVFLNSSSSSFGKDDKFSCFGPPSTPPEILLLFHDSWKILAFYQTSGWGTKQQAVEKTGENTYYIVCLNEMVAL